MIGSSSAAAACGIDPYKSRVRLWAEHVGMIEPTEAGEAAMWGNLLRPVIAAEVEARGYNVVPAPADELHSDEYPWATCHPDAYCSLNGSGWMLLEIKTANLRFAGKWDDDEAPPEYIVRLHHQMLVTGIRAGVLACLLGGQRLVLRTFEFNEKLAAAMVEREMEFLGFVEGKTPPPPDGSEATDDVLRRLYPDANGEIVHLTGEQAEHAREIPKLRAAVKTAEGQLAEREQVLKLALGESPVGWYDGEALVRWSSVSAKRLNQKKLQEAFPDVYLSCVEPSSYRRFSVKA